MATPLAARVGIATGLVVVGDLIGEGAAQEQAVVGETPNLAARLQALAEPGSVVIAEATRRLLGGLFELDRSRRAAAQGLRRAGRAPGGCVGRGSRREPVRGAARRAAHAAGRARAGAGLLLDRWERAKEGEGQVVLLSGEPGIGKSRLVRALRERLGDEPYTPLSYFCSPYHHEQRAPSGDRAARAGGAASAATTRRTAKLDKLEALLAPSDSRMSDEAVPLLAALLACRAGERYPPLELTPQRQKERTLEALVDQLAGLAARQPVLVLYEDVHWVDPTTLELLELRGRAGAGAAGAGAGHLPARVRAALAGQAHVTALTLNRLGRARARRWSRGSPAARRCRPRCSSRSSRETDGVPLFVEELTKAVLEAGLLSDEGDRYELPARCRRSRSRDAARLADGAARPPRPGQGGGADRAPCIGREFATSCSPRSSPLTETDLRRRARPAGRSGAGLPPRHAARGDLRLQARAGAGRGLPVAAQVAAASSCTPGSPQVLEQRFPDTARAQPELLAHHYTEAGLARAGGRTTGSAPAQQRPSARPRRGHRALRKGLELCSAPWRTRRSSYERSWRSRWRSASLADCDKGVRHPRSSGLQSRPSSRARWASAPSCFRICAVSWHFFIISWGSGQRPRISAGRSAMLADEQDPAIAPQAHRARGDRPLAGEFAARPAAAVGERALSAPSIATQADSRRPGPAGHVPALWRLGPFGIWDIPDQALARVDAALDRARNSPTFGHLGARLSSLPGSPVASRDRERRRVLGRRPSVQRGAVASAVRGATGQVLLGSALVAGRGRPATA